jgi:DeoR family transcriptional regulator, aga operon transcriptional repressor
VTKTKVVQKPERLLGEERRQHILDLLEAKGRVTVEELARRFNVSAVTIRTDLDTLAELGALRRAHGGAVKALDPLHDYPLKLKEALHHDQKSRIASAAAQLVKPNQTIILDSGSTTAEIARQLKRNRVKGITVITNSLNIGAELADTVGITVIMIGGILRELSQSCVGPHAEQMMRDLHADHLFLAVDGLHTEIGPSTPDILEAKLNGLMVEASNEITVVADSSKFGRLSMSVIAPMDSVQRVITDAGVAAEYVNALARRGVELIIT